MLSQIGAFFHEFHTQVMDPDRIPVAMMAILVTMLVGVVTGPLAGNANPLIYLLIDKILGSFGDKLDRLKRPPADLVFRGFVIAAVAILLALTLGKYEELLTDTKPYYGITEILLLTCLLSSGTVWYALLRLYFALEGKKTVPGSFYAISRTTRTNLSAVDDFSITRAGITMAARTLDKGLVAPVFWYLVGGLPLATVYGALSCLSWRFGKDGFTKGFGTVPLALEKLMGFVPGALSAILIAFSGAFTPTAGLFRGIFSFFGLKNRAPYEQGGFPLSAMAWSLNVSLGGASQDLSGSAIKGVWAGPEKATAQNDYRHLRRAMYINVMAHILFLAMLGGAYVWGTVL